MMRSSLPCLRLAPELPPYADVLDHIRGSTKLTVAACMARADDEGRVLVQPRIGVGGHMAMLRMLHGIQAESAPDLLTLTIDSYTRLAQFDKAREVLALDPTQLNGYPLVAHGWAAVREIDSALRTPLQVRHGSPDARRLFAESVAGGITSFEGGPIGYNIPYCKSVPLQTSLSAWREVDELVGLLAADGVIVEREMFGSLTGVLVPPSVALSCVLLEAILACRSGCLSVSLSMSQGGHIVQDVAMLRAARQLSREYLPPQVRTHVVLHEFMGVFPRQREEADAIIFVGGLLGTLGGATKIISKTYQEALGRPDADANASGVRLTRAGIANPFRLSLAGNPDLHDEEQQILAEVREIVDPVLQSADLAQGICDAFSSGRLDVPFPASRAARGKVIPVRDRSGAIRYASTGALPFSSSVKNNARCLRDFSRETTQVADEVRDSIFYFSNTSYSGNSADVRH